MSSSRVLMSMLVACTATLLSGCGESGVPEASTMSVGNPITGEGLPNPAPTVMANWGNPLCQRT